MKQQLQRDKPELFLCSGGCGKSFELKDFRLVGPSALCEECFLNWQDSAWEEEENDFDDEEWQDAT